MLILIRWRNELFPYKFVYGLYSRMFMLCLYNVGNTLTNWTKTLSSLLVTIYITSCMHGLCYCIISMTRLQCAFVSKDYSRFTQKFMRIGNHCDKKRVNRNTIRCWLSFKKSLLTTLDNDFFSCMFLFLNVQHVNKCRNELLESSLLFCNSAQI